MSLGVKGTVITPFRLSRIPESDYGDLPTGTPRPEGRDKIGPPSVARTAGQSRWQGRLLRGPFRGSLIVMCPGAWDQAPRAVQARKHEVIRTRRALAVKQKVFYVALLC